MRDYRSLSLLFSLAANKTAQNFNISLAALDILLYMQLNQSREKTLQGIINSLTMLHPAKTLESSANSLINSNYIITGVSFSLNTPLNRFYSLTQYAKDILYSYDNTIKELLKKPPF
jgi:hypothetical protein